MNQAEANKMLLGSIFFQFDTGNSVEYLIEIVNPILGNDGFRLVRHWQSNSEPVVISVLGYYANVHDAVRFALEAWSAYIIKGGMPEVIVTGALDAADVRDMMLYIEEPELEAGDEPEPEPETVVIDPLFYALISMSEAATELRAYVRANPDAGFLQTIADALEDSANFVIVLNNGPMETITNE